MWHKTKLTELLGIKYPIIQGAFGGRFSSIELTSLVSNAGGIGSFGLNAFSAEEIIEVKQALDKNTDQPYILNLWVPRESQENFVFSEKMFDDWTQNYGSYFQDLNIPTPQFPKANMPPFEKQFEAIITAAPPIVSFVFGIPDSDKMKRLKQAGIKVLIAATNPAEALAIEKAGADAIICSGTEAGGHRPEFIPQEQKYTTAALLKAIKNTSKLPLIAAGGISDATKAYEILSLGADAVQLGTAFLATKESNASDTHKEKLFVQHMETMLSNSFTGRSARCIVPQPIDPSFFSETKPVAPYPYQSLLLSTLRKAAVRENDDRFIAYWSGQPSTALKHHSAIELFESLRKELDIIDQKA